jgi:peptidoglycan hydrolase-like protein with peptidoglycan-binding domain
MMEHVMSDDWFFDGGSWGSDWGSGGGSDWSPAAPAAPAAPAWSAPAAPARRDYFDLESDVGRGAANERSDVAKVETTLGHAGYYDLTSTDGPTGYYGSALDQSIRDYQKAGGLEVDGYLAPGGETILGLREEVGSDFAAFDAPTAYELDAHHDALAAGQPGLLSTGMLYQLQSRDDLPALAEADAASATRTARAALTTSDQRPLAEHLSDTLADLGAQGPEASDVGRAYIRDVVGQLSLTDPALGQSLLSRTLANLPEDERAQILGGPMPAAQPYGTFLPGAREAYAASLQQEQQQVAAPAPGPAEQTATDAALFEQAHQASEAALAETRQRLGLAPDGSEDHLSGGLGAEAVRTDREMKDAEKTEGAQRRAQDDREDNERGDGKAPIRAANDLPDDPYPTEDRRKSPGVRGDKDGIGGPEDPGKDSFLTPEFRAEIAARESRIDGYRQIGKLKDGTEFAWGKYQMTESALIDAGLKNKAGEWTGSMGVKSKDDFLNSPEIQEKALEKLMAKNERRIESKGIPEIYGNKIEGLRGTIEITEAGVMAAAHRRGATAVIAYLDHIKSNGWTSRAPNASETGASNFPADKDAAFRAIETRLREFQGETYRRSTERGS